MPRAADRHKLLPQLLAIMQICIALPCLRLGLTVQSFHPMMRRVMFLWLANFSGVGWQTTAAAFPVLTLLFNPVPNKLSQQGSTVAQVCCFAWPGHGRWQTLVF